jgi:tetratricopeptide (TPR) repeat protein
MDLDDDDFTRATELHHRSEERAAAGRLEEARDLQRAAVALFRVAAADPYHADSLATALIDLSIRHAAVGALDEAVTASTEAEAMLRRLAPDNDHAATELAAALMHLAGQQLALGRADLALEPALEAADRYAALCGTNLHGFRRELAGSLENVGACQAQLGETREAREFMQEALAVYRELTEDGSPDSGADLARVEERLRALASS